MWSFKCILGAKAGFEERTDLGCQTEPGLKAVPTLRQVPKLLARESHVSLLADRFPQKPFGIDMYVAFLCLPARRCADEASTL